MDKKTKAVKETMIFPRFHQLDVVTKLVADVSKNGVGKNYLIQHSAGSGKSNSIAWLSFIFLSSIKTWFTIFILSVKIELFCHADLINTF